MAMTISYKKIMKTILKRMAVSLAVVMLTVSSFSVSAAKAKNSILKGTVTVDGEIDAVWENAKAIQLTLHKAGEESKNASGYAKLLWDKNFLYCIGVVTDATPTKAFRENDSFWDHDSFEFFVDEANARVDKNSIAQFRVDTFGKISGMLNDTVLDEAGIRAKYPEFKGASRKTDNGYVVEMAMPWTLVSPKGDSSKLGIAFQINDDQDNAGENEGQINSPVPNMWNPLLYPTFTLSNDKAETPKADTSSKNETASKNDNDDKASSNVTADSKTDTTVSVDDKTDNNSSTENDTNGTDNQTESNVKVEYVNENDFDANAFMLIVLGAVIFICVIGIILVYIFVLRASPKK